MGNVDDRSLAASVAGQARGHCPYLKNRCLLPTDVMGNADDKSLAASVAGQARGHCPYLKNSCFVGVAPSGAALNLSDRRNSVCVASITK
jgi:ribosome modulation factor